MELMSDEKMNEIMDMLEEGPVSEEQKEAIVLLFRYIDKLESLFHEVGLCKPN